MPDSSAFHLAVALDGTGWHPASWRAAGARPAEVLTAGYWTDLVGQADRAGVDFVTIEDSLSVQSARRRPPDGRVDRLRGRLDAVLIAARVAPTTTRIGLVPTATVTHTEPFHISKSIATLDYVSAGRAGWQVKVSGSRAEANHFGRRDLPDLRPGDGDDPEAVAAIGDIFDEAADYVEVVRRLWDSWEDDAEIRDASTGRFIDRDKLHYVDFSGRWFKVRGPSITPRPPQGQPIVAALAHRTVPYRLAARGADVVFVTPRDFDHVQTIVAEVRAEEAAVRAEEAAVRAEEAAVRAEEAARPEANDRLRIFADLVVLIDDTPEQAEQRKGHLDRLDGQDYRSDAAIFTGTSAGLADLLAEWSAAGLAGFRLRPAVMAHDLEQITAALVPELDRRGLRIPDAGGSLRNRLGLGRPANRYAGVSG